VVWNFQFALALRSGRYILRCVLLAELQSSVEILLAKLVYLLPVEILICYLIS
jgi:hypothetical protein